jgi:serine/threonine protein kinase
MSMVKGVLTPGKIVKRKYLVQSLVGSGHTGNVYLCADRKEPQTQVAFKVLNPKSLISPAALARFRREIKILEKIDHKFIVKSFEFIESRGVVGYTMEYLPGGTLQKKIDEGRAFPISTVTRLVYQVAVGTSLLHKAGIVHRDLSPQNILLTEDGDAKIGDFGSAKARDSTLITAQGAVLGTIDYLSPEFVEKNQFDARSDIFALGVIAYQLVTGRLPFEGRSEVHRLLVRVHMDPAAPKTLRPDCPEFLNDLIMRALKKNPAERYQSMIELLRDLLQSDSLVTEIRDEEIAHLSGLQKQIVFQRTVSAAWGVVWGLFLIPFLILKTVLWKLSRAPADITRCLTWGKRCIVAAVLVLGITLFYRYENNFFSFRWFKGIGSSYETAGPIDSMFQTGDRIITPGSGKVKTTQGSRKILIQAAPAR